MLRVNKSIGTSINLSTFQPFNHSTFQQETTMALEVNNQNLFQNAQFQQFVDFAEFWP